MVDATPVDKLIVVLISSHQKEFQEERDALKDAIDSAELFEKFMMKAELVERRAGQRIRGDIASALKDAAIYVGIFGSKFSQITVDEYLDARRKGISLLIFDIPPRRKLEKQRRGRARVEAFLENQVRKTDDCRIATLKRKDMLNGILQRIANEVAQIVQQNLEIRKIHRQ